MNGIKKFIAVGFLLNFSVIFPVTIKKSSHLFDRWIKDQVVLKEREVDYFSYKTDDLFRKHLDTFFAQNYLSLRPTFSLFDKLTKGVISEHGYQFTSENLTTMYGLLHGMYYLLDQDPVAYFSLLKEAGFGRTELSTLEATENSGLIVERNKALIRLMHKDNNLLKEQEVLFGVANRFFEFCFSDETNKHYRSMFDSYEDYSLVRFIHSVIWFFLVGEGWHAWHENCVNALQERSNAGDEIVYPAGGTDWHVLLDYGIYNIRIIDPFLPSQDRYYISDWEWLIKGELGDEIHRYPPQKHLILRRSAYSLGDAFTAHLSTQELVTLPNSITVWTVIDGETEEPVGEITIERRFVTAEDFKQQDGKTLVMSYDELVYAIAPTDIFKGWGITLDSFESHQPLYVKQLRSPVYKIMLEHMHAALIMNFINLKFINFASDPT